jgi:hypothetical protein
MRKSADGVTTLALTEDRNRVIPMWYVAFLSIPSFAKLSISLPYYQIQNSYILIKKSSLILKTSGDIKASLRTEC